MNINGLESDGKILEENVIPLQSVGSESSCRFKKRILQMLDVRRRRFYMFANKNLTDKHVVSDVLQDAIEEVGDPADDIGEVADLIHRHFLQGYQRYVEFLGQGCDILMYHGYNPLWVRFS